MTARLVHERALTVFSRGSLHAKFFIIDKTVIAGSSNISKHAKHVLDEAAVLTDDSATVLRARETFEQLCTEPVRKDYLQKCIDEYKPPKFAQHHGPRSSRRSKVTPAKFWIIGGLHYGGIPEREETDVERVMKTAKKKLLDYERCEVDYSHYPSKMGFFKSLREGDWMITCVADGKGFEVAPPARFLGVQHYARGKGKRRYLLLVEAITDADPIRWTQLRSATPADIPAVRRAKPRTGPIESDADADSLLRLWTARGKFRRKKK